jgi:hypothetical protein
VAPVTGTPSIRTPPPTVPAAKTDVAENVTARGPLRDGAAVQYEAQLDALAGGLIDAFAESDAVGFDSGPRAGLFTVGGSGILPTGAGA